MMNAKVFFASVPLIRLFFNGKDIGSHAMNKRDSVCPQKDSIAAMKTVKLSGHYINNKEVEITAEYTYYTNGNVLVKHMINNRLRMVSMSRNNANRLFSDKSISAPEYRNNYLCCAS
jgi:hypothetical protein